MKEPQDAGKYQVNIDGTVQGSVIGDNPTVHQHFYAAQDKAASSSFLIDPTMPATLSHTNSLLGRDTLLKQMKQRLLEQDHLALTALNGLPGIGKTALAIAITTDQQVRTRFCDGVLWTGLGPYPKVLGQLARWGSLLGIAPADVEDVDNPQSWGRALQAAIGARRLLLVIDDAWTAEEASAFQIGGIYCGHILTTRLPQVAFTFAGEETIVVPELEEADGMALLTRFIPQHVQQYPEDARALIRAVGGLPLALTLMGKYLATQAFTRQPRRLQAALAQLQDTQQRLQISMPTLLKQRSPSLPDNIPLSLYAAIAISDQQLSPQAHNTLCALSVFPSKPNSFSEEAALAVSLESTKTLDALWDAGLLESSGPSRYSLHQTIADYAQTQTYDFAARQRLVNYMLSYIQTYEQDYNALELETNNILAALDTAVVLEMQQDLLQGVTAFVGFLRVRGHYSLADQCLQSALQAATLLEDPLGQMTVLRHLAAFAELRGDYAQAEHYSQLGLVLVRQLECADEVSALLATLGLVAFYRGDNVHAQVYFEEGLQLARQVGKSEQICTLLSDLGRVARSQGNFAQAEAYYHEGLTLARENEHWDLMSFILASLGAITQEHKGDYDQAEQYCLEGLNLARRQGHREHLTHLLIQLGAIAYYRGQYKEAEAYFQEGLVIARQIGHRAQICRLLANLGPPLTAQGEYVQAERYLQEGVELARQLGNQDSLHLLLTNLGSAIGYQGNYERANACFQEGVEVARHLGSRWLISRILIAWGEIHFKYGQLDLVTAALQEVLILTSDPYLIAQAQYGLAQLAKQRGDTIEARRLGTDSLTTFEALGHHRAEEVREWLRELHQ